VKFSIKSVAQMMLDNKQISECDINPLVVTEDNNIFAVDIRVKC
jgi:succinyl-CoA synthetase beta subunit